VEQYVRPGISRRYDKQRFSFDQQDNSSIYELNCENLYITVDLQGDTRQPPVQGFGLKQEVKYDGGLALVDPKSSIENLSDRVLHGMACSGGHGSSLPETS
jgi:hypothetical protein